MQLLTSVQRMAVARVSGAIERLGYGEHKDLPLADKIAGLHAITRDPVVLGHVLGACLVNVEGASLYQGCIDLLRAAGADEGTAQEQVAWRRERDERFAHGGFVL